MILTRPARPDDAFAVESVRIAGWKAGYRGVLPDSYLDRLVVTPERVSTWQERIRTGETQIWVATTGPDTDESDDTGVVGMAVTGPSRDDDVPGLTELHGLYVHPTAWGRGVATALLAACARCDVLWVLEDNPRARGVYERYGLRPDGAVKDFDADGTPVSEVRYRRTGV